MRYGCLTYAKASKNRYVRVAGVATHRQAPETAKGVVFITLEDETGFSNIVVPPEVKDKYRKEIIGGTVLCVGGILQEEATVLHVIARTIDDISSWVNDLTKQDQLILPLLVPRADEIKHGNVGSRHERGDLIKSRDFK